jgi:hypothetical protein
MIGFKDAVLVPVNSWRPRMNSFLAIPSHCNVIVPLEGKWIVIDVATVDCIDGVLDLAAKLNEVQTVNNGVKYKFMIYPDSIYEYSDEMRDRMAKIDPDFVDQKKCVTIGLVKEEPKRNDDYEILQPIQLDWVPRFSFHLPKKSLEEQNFNQVEYLPTLVKIPRSMDVKIAEILVEYTCTYKEPRAHHYKQWVGMKYSPDGLFKYIVAGYRYIECKRPYSNRTLSWCGGISRSNENDNNSKTQIPSDLPVPQNATDEVLHYLKTAIGIQLSPSDLKTLKLSHNYYMPNIDHVWAN